MGAIPFLFVLTLQMHPPSSTNPHSTLSSTSTSKPGQIWMQRQPPPDYVTPPQPGLEGLCDGPLECFSPIFIQAGFCSCRNLSGAMCHLRVPKGEESFGYEAVLTHVVLEHPFGTVTHPWHSDPKPPPALSLCVHPQPGSFLHCSGTNAPSDPDRWPKPFPIL